MNIRFKNARVLTMADGFNIIENAEVHVRGNKITYIGAADKKEDRTNHWHKTIDVKGNLLMPGFKNAHTHSAMTFLRTHADDMKLQDWLTKEVFPYEAKLTAEDIYYCTKLAVLEYLTSGITAICDMYFEQPTIAKATEESGMRCVQTGAISGSDDIQGKIRYLRNMYERLNNGNPLTTYKIGLHAEYTCSKELLEETAKLVNELKVPFYTHMSETKAEVEGCVERYGMPTIEYADSIGLFNYGGAIFHGVHVNDKEIEILKKRGVSVVTNPASNAKLASGIAPVERYMKEGINVAIGTDGPASNNCLDMFREMFLTTSLAKLREDDAAAVDANSVLYMATVGGAKALGLKDSDVLAAGKNADMIMIDLNQPNMRPINNITKNLVYSGSKTNVKMTMIDGKILYMDGKFNIGEDPEAIYSDVQNVIDSYRNGTR
ncbi:MAG: amidohydrolase [Lachnospiraceae bacterium]|nr:amidohydrolase [Lachnospiraceae bacterium]